MAREEAGRQSGARLREVAREGADEVVAQAERAGDLLQGAYGNIQSRYSPFIQSERDALSQLRAEIGLEEGDLYRGYRDSPAYQAAQDASQVAEREALETITQDAANQGGLYSGSRAEALVDRAKQGSYERAGVEQSYYQNYLNMLRDMADPRATGIVSGYEYQTAGDRGRNYINAANTRLDALLGAEERAAAMELGSMRTGEEGAYLRDMLRTGTEGAEYVLNTLPTGAEDDPLALTGFNYGTAGTPYRLGAADTRLNTQASAGGMITGNAPTGLPGSNLRLEGVSARNQGIADLVGGVSNVYSAYINRPQIGPQPPQPAPYYGNYGT